MDDPRRTAFAPYFRALADLIGLRDWAFTLCNAPPDNPNHIAEVDCRYGMKRASIYLGDSFLDADPARQRQTALHELMHCHFAMMHIYIYNEYNANAIGDPAYRAYKLGMEYGIDAAAEALAPHMPTPDEVKPAPE